MRLPCRLTAALAAGLAILASLGGCSSPTMRALGSDQVILPRQAERDLSAGIKAYEEGQYKIAAARLQQALDGGLAFTTDEVAAYKYLAFIHCAAGQTELCRVEFRKAFALDPSFELTKAEAGHPVWGPIYRSVKNEPRTTQR
jgi:Tfp pilus assembly protein PilF